MKSIIKLFKLQALALVAIFFFTSMMVEASHFRYMTMSWEIVSTSPAGTVVEFNITQSWRRSFSYPPGPGAPSGPVTAIGQVKNTGTFQFGDGASTLMLITVNSINTAEDWFVGNATITHTYTGSINRVARFFNCCRIMGLGVNSEDNYDIRTVVTLNDPTNNSPVANTPPIFYVPINQVSNIQLAAFDPDGDALSFAFATTAESGLTQPVPLTPNGPATLSPTGMLSINTNSVGLNVKYATQVKVSDARGATVPLDFVIQTVGVSTPPAFVYPPTPANATVINIGQGNTASFNLEATDTDPGSTVQIFATGLPTGANLTGTPGNPASYAFSWTPTGSDLGAYVIAFTAQDNLFAQAFSSVTINVVPCSIGATSTTTDVSCPGSSDGAIDLTLSGNYGTPTFAWTGPNGFSANTEDISGVAAGSYSVTATGDFGLGCSVTETYIVGTTPDVTAPTIICPSNIVVNNDIGSCGAVVSFGSVGPDFYSTDDDGTTLVKINSTNGVVTDIGSFGYPQTWALAFTPDGSAWTIIRGFGLAQLASVDLNTGAATPIGSPFGFTAISLDANSAGELYAVGYNNRNLYKINTTTGAATLIGNTGILFTMDLAFDSNDKLWGTVGGVLYSINTTTGASTNEANISGGPSQVMGIAIDAIGTFFITEYTSNPRLFTLDPSTGLSTLVASLSSSFRPHGGDFFTSPVDAADNCSIVSIVQTAGLPSNSVFPVGTTTNTFVVTDGSGNTATCSFDVTVTDNEPPIVLAQDISVTLANGSATITDLDVTKQSQWIGYINAFNLPAYNSGVYYSGVESLADLKTTVDANAGTITLQPNFSKYASGDPEYINGAIGNKLIQASTYVEETGLVNQYFAFKGSVVSNTLAPGYDNYAFVRVFDQNFGLLYEVRDPLVAGSDFSVAYSSTPAGAVYVQYGFGVDGLNANPADEAALGSVVVNAIATLGDNCGIASSSIDINSFDCSNIGPNLVELTVTDVNGNSQSATAIVNVIGEIPSCTIVSVPTSNVFTGGNPNVIFLGYGAQSTLLTATASGGSSFTYSWAGTSYLDDATSASPEFTPTAAGSYTYTLTVTNEYGCTSTCDITIEVVDAVCGNNNNKVLVCHNGNTICISPNAVPAHLANHAGDKLGPCTNKTDITGSTAFSAYPSPSTGMVNLEIEILDDAELQIEVFSATGQLVYAETLSEKAGHYVHSIDLSNVSSGVYMIKVMNDGVVEMQRVQIQK